VARIGPSQTEGRSEGELPLSSGVRPKAGLTLLVPDSAMDLSAVVLALRGKGLRPLVAPLAENVFQIIANWRPRATIHARGLRIRLRIKFIGQGGLNSR
jgi:hypothetical protein